jgi:hypothetical protein
MHTCVHPATFVKQSRRLQRFIGHAGVLKYLPRDPQHVGDREAIGEAGAVPHLVRLLGDERSDAKALHNAAAVLWSISTVAANKTAAVRAGAFPVLVRLLRSSSDLVQREAVLGALANLLTAPNAVVEMAAAGGIPLLLEILASEDARLHGNASERLRWGRTLASAARAVGLQRSRRRMSPVCVCMAC